MVDQFDMKRISETRVYVIDESTAAKIQAGTIVYDEPSDTWVFAYSPHYTGSIDPINMPNENGRIYPFSGNTPPGVFADLLPGQFVEEKLSRMIRGYKDMDVMDKLQAIGSRFYKGIGLEVGGNPAFGIDPRPNQLADFDKALTRFGLRDFFDHEEIGHFVRNSPDWNDYLHELKKSYSGQQPLFNVRGVDDKPYLLKLYNAGSVLNKTRLELIAQRTAQAAGARIPDIQLIRMKELGAEGLLIERFDTAEAIANAVEDSGIGSFKVENIQLRSLTITGLQGGKTIHGLHYNSIARNLESLGRQRDGSISAQAHRNKVELFRQSLLNHAFNNIDNHGKNMSVVCRDGQWEMAPVYDMGFFAHVDDMPITFYGEPPIHSADVLDDNFIKVAWEAMNIPEGYGDPFAIRDQVVSAVINDLPREIVRAGVGVDANGKVTQEAKHIVQAVSRQSPDLAKMLTSSLKTELRNHIENERTKEIQRSADTDFAPGN